MRKNPYESKKISGVTGKVPNDFKNLKIFDKGGESIVLYVGELKENAFDFGYEIHLKDNTHLRKLPGVGKGWFKLFKDAEGYAAYAVKIAFSSRFSNEAAAALNNYIYNLQVQTLDLV